MEAVALELVERLAILIDKSETHIDFSFVYLESIQVGAPYQVPQTLTDSGGCEPELSGLLPVFIDSNIHSQVRRDDPPEGYVPSVIYHNFLARHPGPESPTGQSFDIDARIIQNRVEQRHHQES